jgi:hypothetical protein
VCSSDLGEKKVSFCSPFFLTLLEWVKTKL